MVDISCYGTKIFICEDDFASIMTAVYDAWEWRLAKKLTHNSARIEILGNTDNLELFTEYENVRTDEEKCAKVVRSIRNKISEEVFLEVFKATLSDKKDKATAIYNFLKEAFKSGATVLGEYANPAVMRLFELVRYVENEEHKLLGFVRFEELGSGALFSKIAPNNNVITLLAAHFADRLQNENWVIYDERRKISAVHACGNSAWFLTNETPVFEKIADKAENEKNYEDLWKVFFNTIAIEERINYKLQRQFLPLRYRENIVEFK